MFAATLLCQVLLATAAFAVPTSKERLAQRVARRASGLAHLTTPNQAVARPVSEAGSNSTHAEFSSNWSGAVLVAGSVRNSHEDDECSYSPPTVLRLHLLEHVQVRYRHFHRPHPPRALGWLWHPLRLCVGRDRRRHLRQRHPPDRRRLHYLRIPDLVRR